MANFVIPGSNCIRFVDTTGNIPALINPDNTLLQDEYWALGGVDTRIMYFHPFDVFDFINFQFTTDYFPANITIKLYNYSDNTVKKDYTSKVTDPAAVAYAYTDDSGNVKYNISINPTTDSLFGKYRLIITATGDGRPSVEFTSEWFEIGAFSTTTLLVYSESDVDGIYWDNLVMYFRINAICKVFNEIKNTTIDNFENELINLTTTQSQVMKLECDPIPRYVGTLLTLILGHKSILINNIYWQLDGKVKMELIEDSNMYEFTCELRRVEYENYRTIANLTQAAPESADGEAYDDTDGVAYDDTDGVAYI
jgi:hypothetical protein